MSEDKSYIKRPPLLLAIGLILTVATLIKIVGS